MIIPGYSGLFWVIPVIQVLSLGLFPRVWQEVEKGEKPRNKPLLVRE